MIYVDRPTRLWRGHVWCHVVADSLGELHTFAATLGLQRAWFQCPPQVRYPHYDTIASRHAVALALGAVEVRPRVIVAKARLLRAEWLHLQAEAAL